MIRSFNPDGISPPASNYAHGVAVPEGARWLSISGQIGIRPDGSVAEGFEAQLRQCFDNLLVVLRADGMDIPDIVKLTIFVTPHGPDVVTAYRDIRDEYMGAHSPTATYFGVTSLASDALLCEVEALAAKSAS
ncbi:MAG: Rid family hydrolase [Pseudomonadota bacterium]